MGERIGRVKVQKLEGWDNVSLIGKANAAHASKAKWIHSLLPIGRQVFNHLQESRAQSRIMVTWEDKHHHSESPPLPPPSSPQLYKLSMMSHGMEHSFGQLGSAVPAVTPPSFLCTRCLLVGRSVWPAKKPLITLQQLKTSVC